LGLTISIAYTLPTSERLAFGRYRLDVQIKEWTEVSSADFTTVVVRGEATVLEVAVLLFVLALELEVVALLLGKAADLCVVSDVFATVVLVPGWVVGGEEVRVVALSLSSPGTGMAGVGVIGGSTVVNGAGRSACRFSISSELITGMILFRPVLCVVTK
jgi:hypothetical protein